MALMVAIQERNQSDPLSVKKTKRKTASLSFASYLWKSDQWPRPRFFLGDLHMTLRDWQKRCLKVHRAGTLGPLRGSRGPRGPPHCGLYNRHFDPWAEGRGELGGF